MTFYLQLVMEKNEAAEKLRVLEAQITSLFELALPPPDPSSSASVTATQSVAKLSQRIKELQEELSKLRGRVRVRQQDGKRFLFR